MDNKEAVSVDKRLISFEAPAPMAHAIREAAKRELCSASAICRRAVANYLGEVAR